MLKSKNNKCNFILNNTINRFNSTFNPSMFFRNNIDDELLNDEENEECFDIIPIKRKKNKDLAK